MSRKKNLRNSDPEPQVITKSDMTISSQLFSSSFIENYGYNIESQYGLADGYNYGFILENSLGVHKITLSRELAAGEKVRLLWKNGKELILYKPEGTGAKLNVSEAILGTYDEIGNLEHAREAASCTINKVLTPGSYLYFCDKFGNLYKLNKASDSTFTLTDSEGSVTDFTVVENVNTTTVTLSSAINRKENTCIKFKEIPNRYDYHTSIGLNRRINTNDIS